MNEFMKIYEDYDFGLQTLDLGMIYHYTSPEALKSIIEKKEIWFSDRIFMNDSSDGNYIKDLILQEKDFIIKELGLKNINFEYRIDCTDNAKYHGEYNTYVLSFSLDADNLALWNYYTKNSRIQGYNIGIDISELTASLKYINKETKEDHKINTLHGKVIYDKEKQLGEIRRLIYYFSSYIRKYGKKGFEGIYFNQVLNKLALLGKFFKKKEFEVENEYRIIMIHGIKTPQFSEKIDSKVEFRIKDGYFIPYIPLEFELNAIESITISPTIDKELAIRGISQILSKADINADVMYSEIPVRY